MPTIIVCSNFSATSRNALAYACSLINSKADKEGIDILLLHIFNIPANYSGEGIALAAFNDGINFAEEDLNEELEWAHETYPDVNVIGKITTGHLLKGLEEQVKEMHALLVIMGTGGHYGELWSWDNNILNALRSLSVPLLTIPPNVTFSRLQNIAFSCNLKYINPYTPFITLKNIVGFLEARLHIVYVAGNDIKKENAEAKNEVLVRNQMQDTEPVYHTLFENNVIDAVVNFVEEQQIQLLLVIPKKYGLWESLFHKSYTKELARLNKLPVMALH